MQKVLVLDKNKQPLMPCAPARARQLLNKGKAAVFRKHPFTIILRERDGGDTQPIALKIDPGSKTTGMALVAEGKRGKRVVWAGELSHRGGQIREALTTRRAQRRGRRFRHTRYRAARFRNRLRRKGWLPPSIQSRVDNIMTWVSRLWKWTPLTSLSLEWVKFDTQAMQNAEISGIEYQQGELWGYEIREYLLEKWRRTCAYCGVQNVPFEVEHIMPKSRGGSNRVSNLTLSCHNCNERKGSQTAAEFGYPEVQAKASQPLQDAAAVNAARWKLYTVLADSSLPLEVGTGGRTKFNRTRQSYPKTHWLDAVCVGESGADVFVHPRHAPLHIKAVGRQSRQMCRPDRYGFPRTSAKGARSVKGFQTGDIVKAVVTAGKKIGTYVGRVAVRSSGSFDVTTALGTLQGISYKYCAILHQSDGYTYTYRKGELALPPPA